jgi:hypothetical protein
MVTWTCSVANCSEHITLGPFQPWWDIYFHLVMTHGYPFQRVVTECLCAGCRCAKQGPSGDRCASRSPGHGWHGADIVDHLWKEHMLFRDVCPQCGDANFVKSFTFGRHVSTCAGRVPSRCRICLVVFPSKVALGGHVELGQCAGAPNITSDFDEY